MRGGLPNSSVSTSNLIDSSVTSAKLANSSVTTEKTVGLRKRITVGPSSNYTTLHSAVTYFNSVANTSDMEILLDAGNHSISGTITVDNSSYNLQIRGLGSAVTHLNAATGLTNNPMFIFKTACDINKVSSNGSTLASYGTQVGENFINLTTNTSTYHEITDLIIDTFHTAISDQIGKNVFLFNYLVSSCVTGSIINYSATPASSVTFDAEVGNYAHCTVGIDLAQATKSNFILNHLVFKQQNSTDIAIKYTGGTFVYKEIANILNCTYNYNGELLSGFDFTRTDGRDANIIIKGNVGEEDKTPHAKINAIDNTVGVVCTVQGTYYKVGGINSKTNVACDAASTGGTFTLTIDGETTAAIAWNANAATMVTNIQTAVNNLTAITACTVTQVVAHQEWNIEFTTAGEGFIPPHSATNSLTSVTSITVTPSFYTCKIAAGQAKMTNLAKYPYDAIMIIGGNLSVNNNNDSVNIAIKKNNSKIISPFSVKTSTSSTPYPFSLAVYLDDIAQNDYFELFVANTSSGGRTVIVSDLTWYFTAR